MNSEDYVSHDALALAALIDAGEVSPLELMICAIALAERHAGLNAICYPDFDGALDRARTAHAQGQLRAIPFLLKDSGLPSRHLLSSAGSRLFADSRFSIDATLFNRFSDAGLLPFARTTVPEFSMAPTTEGRQNGGPTKNPWDDNRSAGGSSGGAGVAVVTGIVPIAHGSDGGGSGQPVASLPLHRSAEGLPVGVQLIGKFGSEAELLQLSAHLEAASTSWGRARTEGRAGKRNDGSHDQGRSQNA